VLLVAVCVGSARLLRVRNRSTCMADVARHRFDPAVAWRSVASGSCSCRKPLLVELPVARLPAAAARRLVPRRHRDRRDGRDSARPDRPVGAVGRGGRRHDGDRGDRLGSVGTRSRSPSASRAAC
jgi:hypothetical protein